jgi:hypothetical protein
VRSPGRAGSASRPPWSLWIFLTLLVWGLFAPDRGLYQDDVSVLAVVKEAWKASGVPGLFAPMGGPTRRLVGLPTFLAWLTPEPVFALQLLTGLSWIAIGWTAWRLARELFPNAPRVAWLAGTLTICATGDFLTASPVALSYQTGALLGLAALLFGLRFVHGAPWGFLAAAAASAAASVFTSDGATMALGLAPLLFVAAGGLGARAALATAVWAAALAPYGFLLAASFRAPGSYVSLAAAPLSVLERVQRTAALTANDLLPWTWPLARVPFGDAPPRAIPVWIWTLAGFAGAAAVLRALRRLPADRPVVDASRERILAGWCLVAALACHAAYAGVHFASYFYRTQVLSRVLVSIVLALVAGRLLARGRAARAVALSGVVLFTGFGVAGGMERQDMYLATWRRHRVELASLVEEVPRATPGTKLLLVVPHDPAYQATEAPYLARRWSELLWGDARTRPETFLWSGDARTACVAGTEGFRCRLAEEKECFDAGACPGLVLRWEELVVLTWHPLEGRFRLEDRIPEALLGNAPAPTDLYRPRALILAGPPDPAARKFLHGDVALARLLP